jgi:hypothetical protein
MSRIAIVVSICHLHKPTDLKPHIIRTATLAMLQLSFLSLLETWLRLPCLLQQFATENLGRFEPNIIAHSVSGLQALI